MGVTAPEIAREVTAQQATGLAGIVGGSPEEVLFKSVLDKFKSLLIVRNYDNIPENELCGFVNGGLQLLNRNDKFSGIDNLGDWDYEEMAKVILVIYSNEIMKYKKPLPACPTNNSNRQERYACAS